MKKNRVEVTTTSNTDAQQRNLVDFSFIVNHIKHFALRSAIRLLDGMIRLLDMMIAFREMVTHER